ncbi:SPFH domain-containing protein [Kribbella hippodromi]|uniref:SPFH domain-containing protein n=1 Tax=Kribbella hippodromi TaxID=434347 RepID=A0ABP4PA28_9ACTN
MTAFLIVLALVALLVIVTLIKSVRVVQQQTVGIVERFGKFKTGLQPGLNLLTPFVDKVRYTIDMREQVVAFPPQGVITEDNLMVSIDSVIYFQVNDPVRATYEISNYIQAIEQLTMTTLRNIIGGMDLEQTLTSREEINEKLRYVLDEATGKWGIRVNRVELRSIDPPPSIQDSMEKQMRADRDKRAAILTAEGMRQSAVLSAEGQKQSAILTAEGDKQSRILRAEAERQARILKAQGEAQAITTVFNAIHAGKPDQGLLAYQYLQMLPSIAQGDANKLWIVPSEIGDALKGLGSAVGQVAGITQQAQGDWKAPELSDGEVPELDAAAAGEGAGGAAVAEADNAVREAIAAAESAAVGNNRAGVPPTTPSIPAPAQEPPAPEPPSTSPPQR